jgi:ATP-dependent Lon protease
MASPYWQMVRDCDFAQVPDTYLDFLMGLPWFVQSQWSEAVARELATRKRSHYHVEDKYGGTLED